MGKVTIETTLLALALGGLALGGAAQLAGHPEAARLLWTLAVLPVLARLAQQIIRGLRRGDFGLDIVAGLSMTAALLTGEVLAAAVVAVMLSGGTFLERFAEGRARREMRALLERVPRQAQRYGPGGLSPVPLDAVLPGDRLLIRKGDVLPVDGRIASARAFLDTAALTGEPLPQRLDQDAPALSGSVNAGEAFDLVATRPAAQSTYAGILRLVEAAQRSKAPLSRLADRWALGFLALTLALAGAAWALTGDAVRAVAVLVVATPCPLILAVPVAFVAGLSRAAQHGVLIKGAGALERMAGARVLILDKTGTLTLGHPSLQAIEAAPGVDEDEVLRLAAALDQASPHPVAQALTQAARARGMDLPLPVALSETPGEGIQGRIGDALITVGQCTASPPQGQEPQQDTDGAMQVQVTRDGRPLGRITLADPLRPEAPRLLHALRAQGLTRLLVATGDRPQVAARVTRDLPLDAVAAGLSPADKLALVQREQAHGPVMMVGDGVNDAPALAAASVGVAMGARGAAAAAEAADVVLLVDRLDRLAQGLAIARGARRIAGQSVAVGLGLSVAGMLAAGAGLLDPVQGALLQEAIDVAVILNALRVLRLAPPHQAPRKSFA